MTPARLIRWVVAPALILWLSACSLYPWAAPSSDATSSASTIASPASKPKAEPPPVLTFDDAIRSATNQLFATAQLSSTERAALAKHELVIDPLIDGATGFQVTATRSMQSQIIQFVQEDHPEFEIRDFTQENIATGPLVLLGSLAGIDKEGKVSPDPQVYRIWLVLADLKSGKIVGKATARASIGGVDLAPGAFFDDSPTWTDDKYIDAYLKTCGGSLGDPIDPTYLDGILVASLVGSAIEAYDGEEYAEALDLYTSAASLPAGDQLRVHTGIYLTNWQLGHQSDATQAFGQLVDFGLKNGRLAMKFLFKPGSTRFWQDPEISGPYELWLEQIAHRVEQNGSCVEIVGHTSPTGPAALNDRLSYLRAEFIETKLETEEPQLASRTIARGVGSREAIVGTGTDDATDALDRRVEFKLVGC